MPKLSEYLPKSVKKSNEVHFESIKSQAEELEIRNECTGTAEKAMSVLEHPHKKTKKPSLNLKQAAEALTREGLGLNLLQAFHDDQRDIIRWGLRTFKPESIGWYRDRLRELRIGEHTLRDMIVAKEKDPEVTFQILVGVDCFSPASAFQTMIIDAGIPFEYQNKFTTFFRLNRKTGKIMNSRRPDCTPGISLVPNYVEVPERFRGSSANDHFASLVSSKKRSLGPVGWMRLFRKKLDCALLEIFSLTKDQLYAQGKRDYKSYIKEAFLDPAIHDFLFDTENGTMFPEFKDKEGNVPVLQYDSFNAKVLFGSYPSDLSSRTFGYREVIGNFFA